MILLATDQILLKPSKNLFGGPKLWLAVYRYHLRTQSDIVYGIHVWQKTFRLSMVYADLRPRRRRPGNRKIADMWQQLAVVTRLAVGSDLPPGWIIRLFTLPGGTKRPVVETAWKLCAVKIDAEIASDGSNILIYIVSDLNVKKPNYSRIIYIWNNYLNK